ncbi:hypothetical protein A3195_06400 [Candidatus Thiodiazotropha endoloripes]|uniref:hypothetical protein n=1 Tax=Candidatus Thiodiazotropha endoloripes TaxID=1818881 RepID=UPI00083D78F9|nr:hypothetical protein [Candidatus Thiodiazotropha endoloripes]ODB84582.1 hypothetical protein A3193_17510 [Candidatus Thiodiazotropha endoloripes]ODB91052.1 hypothetical protein A3195_06400 [Candidatus Thiodiazotropha endoloripes]
MSQTKKEPSNKDITCNSFEEWRAHYLPKTTEREITENLRSDTSKLAVTLANKTIDDLLSQKALNK